MMRLGCIPTELLLERQSPALSHAERLRVESHLAECENCRREHGAMLTLRDLVEEKVQGSVKSSVQDRAIARALFKGGKQHELPAARSGIASAPRVAWGLALVAAVALVSVFLTRRGNDQPPVTATAKVGFDHVSTGKLRVGDELLAAGDRIPEGQELYPQGAALLALAHAELSVERAEAVVWSARERTVTLRGAVANVQVDPSRRQSFRVATPHFLVEVLGTHFRIAHDTVSVERGRVRVSSLAQAPLAELGPGQSWTFKPQPSAPAPEEVAAAQPARPQSSAKSESGDSSRSSSASIPELLARARHRLSSGDARGARSDLEAALAGGGSRAQQAEAFMLKGDCSLVEGDSRGAVRAYLDVSQRFAGSRTAETALFAAARVQSQRGDKAAAKKLLLTYRDRYPTGQFRSEVDARLRTLDQK